MRLFPGIPGSLICEVTFLMIFNLYNVEKIIGVPYHILAECTTIFGLFIDYFPRLFYAVKGHDFLKLRCEHIHTQRPQNRGSTAQGNCLMKHGIGRRLVFFKGVVFPAVARAGKATGKEIAGVSVIFLCRKQ